MSRIVLRQVARTTGNIKEIMKVIKGILEEV